MIDVNVITDVSPDSEGVQKLRPLFQGLADHDIELFKANGVNVTEAQKESIINSAMSNVFKIVIAEENNVVVGMCIVPIWDENLISEVFVIESHRRRGLGKEMIRTLTQVTGIYHRVNVTIGNESAIKFYESLGFKKATIGMIQHD